MMANKTLVDKMRRTVATPEQLEQMDHDLRFHAASPEADGTLTAQQVEAFNRDGYLMLLPIVDESEIAEQRQFFEELVGEAGEAGYDAYSLIDTHLTHRRAYDRSWTGRRSAPFSAARTGTGATRRDPIGIDMMQYRPLAPSGLHVSPICRNTCSSMVHKLNLFNA